MLAFLWKEGSELAGDPCALYLSLLSSDQGSHSFVSQLVQIARSPPTFPKSDISFSCSWCLLSVLFGSLGPCLGWKCWKAGEVGCSLVSSARAICFSGVVPGACGGVHIGITSVWPPVVLASCGVVLLTAYPFIRYADVFLESRIPVKMIQPLLPGDGGRKGKVAVCVNDRVNKVGSGGLVWGGRTQVKLCFRETARTPWRVLWGGDEQVGEREDCSCGA